MSSIIGTASAWEKYLSSSDLLKAESVRYLTFRQSKLKRQLYRRAFHAKHKEEENGKNLKAYHSKYKTCPEFKRRASARYSAYRKKMGLEWDRLRSRKYRKPYSALSEKQKNAIRNGYKLWAKNNWDRRVKYARDWRSKQPTSEFRKAIGEAARTGDFAKLAIFCEHAIGRAHEASRGKRSHADNGAGRVRVRENSK